MINDVFPYDSYFIFMLSINRHYLNEERKLYSNNNEILNNRFLILDWIDQVKEHLTNLNV